MKLQNLNPPREKFDIKLKIGEILILPSNRKFILCCTEPNLDQLIDKDIISMLCDKYFYLYVNNELIKSLRVRSVEISSSIVGQKNIYLLIDDDISNVPNVKGNILWG